MQGTSFPHSPCVLSHGAGWQGQQICSEPRAGASWRLRWALCINTGVKSDLTLQVGAGFTATLF